MKQNNKPIAKHTQGEWKLEYDFSIVMKNQVVCTRIAPDDASREEAIANAKRIVQMHNTFDELVDVLKKMVVWANIQDGSFCQPLRDEALNVIRKAKE